MIDDFKRVPSLEEAVRMVAEAGWMNPGPWVQHSLFTALAAKIIANHHPKLDPELAYLLAYLHDIGRREGVSDMRHTLDGYSYLHNLGYEGAARICMTHSFPLQNVNAISGEWDCSAEELAFAEDYLKNIEYTEYDRLVQLCDALAVQGGFCLIEKRIVDVAIRRGINALTVEKWKAYFEIQRDFEQVIGRSIYDLLPGVVENTFGLDT
jgi:hypothetical protein